ncbi:MAG: radical SAM protein, partial [Candidatus Omnitrophica bacterium]|nr:radical SAM protein [Candidatus Omnitrophota bacterium]
NPLLRFSNQNIFGKVSPPGLPLGLAYLASFLMRAGFKVSAIDANLENISNSAIGNRLPENPPDIIGITSYTPGSPSVYELAEICKSKYPSTKIVVGGPHFSVLPEEALSSEVIDYVIRGDGEETFLELANGHKLSEIDGLSFKMNKSFFHNKDRQKLIELDRLPFPAYELFNPKKYSGTLGRAKQKHSASIITSRGCPFSCAFCQAGCLHKTFRIRSAENILAEIELLINNYGIKEFAFQDDILTFNKKILIQLCELLVKKDIKITWSCLSRVDTIDRELLKVMKSAGCYQIGFGIESGNDNILRQIHKNITIAKAEAAVKMAQSLNFEVATYFMLGLPGETRETLRQTLKFSRSLNVDYCLYNILVPLPRTEIYEWAKKEGYLATTDWKKYTGSEVILDLPSLHNVDLKAYYKNAFIKFYLNPSYILRHLKKMRSLIDLMYAIKGMLLITLGGLSKETNSAGTQGEGGDSTVSS